MKTIVKKSAAVKKSTTTSPMKKVAEKKKAINTPAKSASPTIAPLSKKPRTTVKKKTVPKKTKQTDEAFGNELRMNVDDKALFLGAAQKVHAGVIVKAGVKMLSISVRNQGKEVHHEISRDAVLAVSNPTGIKTPELLQLSPYAGQGFLTVTGKSYLMAHPPTTAPNKKVQELHVGDTVRLMEMPFGYPLKDAMLALQKSYECIGFLGELIITTSDIDGEIAMYHERHVVLDIAWKKAA